MSPHDFLARCAEADRPSPAPRPEAVARPARRGGSPPRAPPCGSGSRPKRCPMCGSRTAFGSARSGLSGGSGSSSKTSSPAAASRPERSAATSAASSRTPPRVVFTRTAPGFMRADRRGVEQARVSGDERDVEATRSRSRASRSASGPARDAGHRAAARRPAEHAHAEALRAAGDRASDRAQPDEAERRAVEVAAEEEVGFPAPLRRPGAGAHEPVGLGDATRRGKEQRECEVRRRLREDARRVADADPPLASRGEIHVIETDRAARHDAEARARGQERAVDPVGEEAEEPFGVLGLAPELGGRWRFRTRPDPELDALAERGEGVSRERSRRKDRRPTHVACIIARGPLNPGGEACCAWGAG